MDIQKISAASGSIDVCLVSMPYHGLERPSLGLSLLQAALVQRHLSVQVFYAGFQFAEKIGLAAYRSVSLEIMNQLGEWSFGEVAFPEFHPDHAAYLAFLSDRACADLQAHDEVLRGTTRHLDLEFLLSLRQHATEFVNETVKRILATNPKIVGCSTQFQQHVASISLLRRIKELCPDIITVIGGTNCDGSLGRITKKMAPWIDYVFSGEADQVFPDLCQHIIHNNVHIPSNELSPSVIDNSRLNLLTATIPPTNPDIAVVRDMDSLPIPCFDDFFTQFSKFTHKQTLLPWVLFESSRGCWWHEKTGGCTFCSVTPFRHCFRSKSPARFVSEFKEILTQYPTRILMATDDVLDPKYFDTVLPALLDPELPKFIAFLEVKSDLGEKQLQLMGATGMRFVQPGIESLHDEVLKAMRKGVTAINHIALLKFALENGVRFAWHLLYGLPNENDEWYKETAELLPLIAHLQPPDGAVRIHFDRFSHFFIKPQEFGLSLVPHRAYSFAFPLEPHDLADFAFFFENEHTIQTGVADAKGIVLLKSAIAEWQKAFALDVAPTPIAKLQFIEIEGIVKIIDTRYGTTKQWNITANEKIVLDECRTPISHQRLLANLLNKDQDWTAVIDILRNRGLLLQIKDRLLSLVTYPPQRLLPSFADLANYLSN